VLITPSAAPDADVVKVGHVGLQELDIAQTEIAHIPLALRQHLFGEIDPEKRDIRIQLRDLPRAASPARSRCPRRACNPG